MSADFGSACSQRQTDALSICSSLHSPSPAHHRLLQPIKMTNSSRRSTRLGCAVRGVTLRWLLPTCLPLAKESASQCYSHCLLQSSASQYHFIASLLIFLLLIFFYPCVTDFVYPHEFHLSKPYCLFSFLILFCHVILREAKQPHCQS